MTHYSYTDPVVAREEQTFLTRVFGWMSAGLVISAATAYWAGTNPSTAHFLQHGGFKTLLVLLAPLGILLLLTRAMDSISPSTAYLLYGLFCAVQGFSLGIVFIVYTTGSLATTFLITAGMFGGMAIFGYATKRDLSGAGSLLGMACGVSSWR
jgi:FtsH-binding integral membrane protein